MKYKAFGTRFAIGFDWTHWLVGFGWFSCPQYCPGLDIHFHIGPLDFIVAFERKK
jgi:hypothetical protein